MKQQKPDKRQLNVSKEELTTMREKVKVIFGRLGINDFKASNESFDHFKISTILVFVKYMERV